MLSSADTNLSVNTTAPNTALILKTIRKDRHLERQQHWRHCWLNEYGGILLIFTFACHIIAYMFTYKHMKDPSIISLMCYYFLCNVLRGTAIASLERSFSNISVLTILRAKNQKFLIVDEWKQKHTIASNWHTIAITKLIKKIWHGHQQPIQGLKQKSRP